MSCILEFTKDDYEGVFIVGENGEIGPFKNELEAIYLSEMNMCSCGNPEDVRDFLFSCLCAQRDKDFIDLDKVTELVKQNPSIVAEFIVHFLDSQGLVEHGSSVFGCWLTSFGNQCVDIFNRQQLLDAVDGLGNKKNTKRRM